MDEYCPVVEQELNADELIKLSLNPFFCHIFRGLGDSSFELIPAAYRSDGFSKLHKIVKGYSNVNNALVFSDENPSIEYLEYASLIIFNELSNDQGLLTPTDIPHTLDLILNTLHSFHRNGDNASWNSSLENIASIAQHHGIPTRLLDWTTDFNVALYFAISNARRLMDGMKENEISSKQFSIWIMNTRLMNTLVNDLHLLKTNYYQNQNIKAQSGLFSILRNTDLESRKKPLDDLVIDKYKKRLEDGNNSFDAMSHIFGDDPILRKINVSYSLVDDIYKNITRRGLYANRFFPGYDGVVKTMYEFQ